MSDSTVHAIAGAGGGIISMALTYPLITVSSRLQVQKDKKSKDSYKSGADAVKKILAKEGIAGLYSGLDSALFGISLTNYCYYYFYEFTKSWINKAQMSTIESMSAGAVAGAATVLITNPIWVVNTRIATRNASAPNSRPMGTIETATQMIKDNGIKSFWQGVAPALILVANPIIQYTVFEKIKTRISKSRALTSFDFFLLGAISKLAATSITYPYIVVKSRMQLKQSDDAKERYSSIMDGFRKIIKYEGVAGLYKGISSKIVQSILTASFLFMAQASLVQYVARLLTFLGMRAQKRI
ncbi:solute carrier family 25 (peroxisomal adenine nucleotide transporter), member 17 [Entomortierella parvispora]|uniref:Solute carrier family 25 (Peroxisomal adenine nucleotide transporter), member 17 n=1 Tax=Entomortierella parvispora TaxID=205924 RepID=A0A9P3LXY9_9FUNG|nr:solute carrier family 25 (peroxisomal adenine nucleotide transporter), member 17 [Entomortierella parvispora]